MIGISKLYCGTVESSDPLRYGRASRKLPGRLLQFSAERKPVVVWNCTRRCNLSCAHCYSRSGTETAENELTSEEGLALLEDLARFGTPVILFSGGEPLLRPDLLPLAARARELGMRVVISTNGTLITPDRAAAFAQIGVSYVGISLDGMRAIHDRFRGSEGAWDRAVSGMQNCLTAGLKVGVRFTITQATVGEIPPLFDLVRNEGIPRICFYHLVYAGRGSALMEADLDHEATRRAVDIIMDRTAELHREGHPVEALTVDNHADGPYLYLRMLREGHPRASDVLELLRMNGGSSSGRGIGCVSWDGTVHPDQFWRHVSLGNVRRRRFSEIWRDLGNPLLAKLKDRRSHVTGRCSTCRFLDMCGGNCRVRAEAATGDLWAPDPACYLTDEEIAP